MKIDELKQTLTEMADEVEDRGGLDRLAGVDHKVTARRRTTAVGMTLAAVVTAAAVAIVPNLDGSHHTPPADTNGKQTSSLPTITDKGTSFYSSPGGAALLGHVVAEPGQREVSFTFTPDTLNLSWEQFCWDPSRSGSHGAEYSTFVNGHPLGGSTCAGGPDGPMSGTSSFGDGSPRRNAMGWARLDVRVGKSSTFTVRITKHADRSVDPQLGAAVYAHAPQMLDGGVWYDRQVVYLGHTYEAAAVNSAALSGRLTRVSVDLPPSDTKLYVFQGATHLKGQLKLITRGGSGMLLPAGSLGGGNGDLVDPDQGSVTVSGASKDGKSTGTIYVVVYQRVT